MACDWYRTWKNVYKQKILRNNPNGGKTIAKSLHKVFYEVASNPNYAKSSLSR